MGIKALLVPVGFVLAACATAQPQEATSWGKPNVTLVQFWTDSSECALAGASAQASGNSNLQGAGAQSDYGRSGAGGGSSAQGGSNDLHPVGTSGAEVSTNMYDVASRAQYNAAVAQRNADRARTEVVNQCLAGRGYHQYRLTAEQSAHLATLPEGSAERRAYLHQLGSDPAVQAAQGL